jgi:hypothetical protein
MRLMAAAVLVAVTIMWPLTYGVLIFAVILIERHLMKE